MTIYIKLDDLRGRVGNSIRLDRQARSTLYRLRFGEPGDRLLEPIFKDVRGQPLPIFYLDSVPSQSVILLNFVGVWLV